MVIYQNEESLIINVLSANVFQVEKENSISIPFIERNIKNGSKLIEKKLENIGEVETVNPKLLDFRLTQNIAQQELLKEYNNILAEDLSNVDSKENVKKVDEEVKNEESTIQNGISNKRKDREQSNRVS